MSIYYSLAKKNINNAINTLNQLTTNVKFAEMHDDIVVGIVNAIHSIVDYYERLDKNMLTYEDDLLFRAYAYINNQIKHDKQLEIIHYPVYCSMYPMGYPRRYGPPGVSWNNFIDNGRKSARGKREHYDIYLCHKNIKCTLNNILEVIEKVNKRNVIETVKLK